MVANYFCRHELGLFTQRLPFGKLADYCSHRMLLANGLCILMVADLILAYSGSLTMTFLGVGLWGLHLGATQSLFAAMVAGVAFMPIDKSH